MIGTEHLYLELDFVIDVVDANVNVDGVDDFVFEFYFLLSLNYCFSPKERTKNTTTNKKKTCSTSIMPNVPIGCLFNSPTQFSAPK